MFHRDVYQPVEGRIPKHSTVGHLTFIHPFIVVVYHIPYCLVIWVECLYDNLPPLPVPPCAPAHLCHLLERPFVCSEIGKIYQVVSTYYSYHSHMVKIQSLCHHLRPHKYVYPPVLKVIDDFKVPVLLHRAVQVHTRHPRIRKQDTEVILNPFRPETFHGQMFAVACRTLSRQWYGIAAIVAPHTVGSLVVHQRHIAVLALRCPVAVVAFHPQRKPSSILEQYHLLMVIKGLLNFFYQKLREMAAPRHGLLSLLPPQAASFFLHVGAQNLRHKQPAISVFHLAKTVFPLFGVVITFQRWCCRT